MVKRQKTNALVCSPAQEEKQFDVLFIQRLDELESGTEEGVKMCCQKEGMEPWDSPFGNSELLGLAALYRWWRVICDLTAVWEREKEAQL